MPNENTVPPDFREEHDPADKEAVERERAEAAKFVAGLSIDDIRSNDRNLWMGLGGVSVKGRTFPG